VLTGGSVLPGVGAGFTEPVPPPGVVPVAGAGMGRSGTGSVAPGACVPEDGVWAGGRTGAGDAGAEGRTSSGPLGSGVTPLGLVGLASQFFGQFVTHGGGVQLTVQPGGGPQLTVQPGVGGVAGGGGAQDESVHLYTCFGTQ